NKVMLKDAVINVSRYERDNIGNIAITDLTNANIYEQDISDIGHGSVVSQVIAGDAAEGTMSGLAKNKSLIYAAQTTNAKGESFGYVNFYAMLDLNKKYGVKLFNASWGGKSGERLSRLSIESRQAEEVVKTGSLMVFATGNEYQKQPSNMSLMPINNFMLEKGILAVTGVDASKKKLYQEKDQVNGGANACGDAARWCLAADYVTQPYRLDSSLETFNVYHGTSFATPQVTSTAALVWYEYPWMTADQVRQTILTTAEYIDDGSTFDKNRPYNKTTGWGYYSLEDAVNGPAGFYSVFGTTFDANVTVDSSFLNDIKGDSGLTKRGQATLYALGNYTYKGDTDIKEGQFNYYGAMTGMIYIYQNATVASMRDYLSSEILKDLADYSGISDTSFNSMYNRGTLSTQTGNISVRNYIQTSTGTLLYDLAHILKVNTATLSGNLDVTTTKQQFTLGNYTVIDAKTSILGKFDKFKSISPFLQINKLTYNLNSVVANIGFSDARTSGVIQSAVSAPAGQLINQITEQAVSDYTSGDVQSSAVQYAAGLQTVSNSVKAQTILNSNSGSIFAETPSVLLQNQAMLVDSIARRTSNLTDARSGVWANTQYLNNKNGATGWDTVNSSITAITAGVDQLINPDFVLGGYISQYKESSSFSLNGDKNKVDMIFGGLYGKYTLGQKYISMTAQYGDGNSKFDRRIETGTTELKSSSLGNIKTYGMYSEFGYQFDLNQKLMINPFVGLSYAAIKQGEIYESNRYGLAVNKIDSNETRAKLGLHSLFTLTDQFKLGGFTEYSHVVDRSLGNVTIKSNIVQSSVSYQAPEFKKGYMTLGLNGQYETMNKKWKFFGDIAYLNSSKSNYQGQVGVKYSH
ncbi:autotransporter domain-containing protein, partial [Acinetobacter sp. B10A]|uniref:autotransporter domain-containing protein n=1 Tax=Acinetobacter baretiae TaxID=2605383 RepID=UPI001B3C4F14